jgi:hypothetical protein
MNDPRVNINSFRSPSVLERGVFVLRLVHLAVGEASSFSLANRARVQICTMAYHASG